MKLFFSGFGKRGVDLDPRIPSGMRYRLLSCHEDYLSVAHAVSADIQATEQPHELMYDSGAFTAWSRGKRVELDDLMRNYDSMLNQYGDKANAVWFISLDVIPGSPGRTALGDEIIEACRVSDENFSVLQKRYGARVLPVFHQNESLSRLHEVERMAPYICVSPRNDLPERARRNWAMEVHAKIPDKPTHGLATTGHAMLRHVPWTSADSATYVMVAMNGGVFRNSRLRILYVSEHSGLIKDKDKHYRTLPLAQRETFRQQVEQQGFSIDRLETDLFERLVYNRVMMTRTQRQLPEPQTIAREIPVQEPLFEL
ncbi:MAG TPA: hypothetical protein VIY48_08005 [Candidatus Paceibacterota bacterium]